MVCPLGFVGSEWILLGVSKWSDLESRFRLGVTIPWVFFPQDEDFADHSCNNQYVMTLSDGYCRMG